MKKAIKLAAAIMLVAAVVFCIASCNNGVDMNKLKGEWTISTVDGMSVADFAATKNAPAYLLATNYTITDKQYTEKALNSDGSADDKTFDIQTRDKGFEVMKDGAIDKSVIYDASADTLTYNQMTGGVMAAYVLKRGTTDLTALYNEFAAAQGGGEEAPVDEGGEEYSEEDYNEE